ncbi:MAG: helix-turn-helix transcriptional regulator [Clostridia bacterium]|nr:helix-turn-helix transcriptional regulator [Clostridia bacterium]
MYTLSIDNLPYVSMTGKLKAKKGWVQSGRKLDCNLFVYVHRGECSMFIDGVRNEYKKGNLAIVPKDTMYRTYSDTGMEFTFFHFDGDITVHEGSEPPVAYISPQKTKDPLYGTMERADRTVILDKKILDNEASFEIEMLLTKCVNAKFRYGESANTLLSIYFAEILFHASRTYCSRFETDENYPPAINKIIAYINANYMRKITLDELCEEVNISKQYCMRIFKKHMHTTINDYILTTRMKHAAYCLRHTYMNVNEAASYLGFSSVSYFSRVFKDYYGVAPSEYFE